MNKLTVALAGFALFTGVAAAQPVVSSATNAASYALPELPSSGIARGSMFVIFGDRMGPANLDIISSFPVPLALSGTSVKATVAGTTVDCYMIYTSARQAAAIMPSNTPAGNGTLTVTYNGQTSAPLNIRVVQSAWGTFSVNQAGSGPGIVQNVVSESDRPINALNKPARPGQAMILWGTGLGPVTGAEREGVVPGDLNVNVEVYVGGRRANITYKGRSGCCAGLDQIVFTVPEGVEGCYVPVVVKIDNSVSNFTSMAVSRTNTCSDVNGLSAADIDRAQSSGAFRYGNVGLTRTATKLSIPGFGEIDSKSDVGSAIFYRYDLSRLLSSQGVQSNFGSTTLGACTVYTFRGSTNPGTVDPVRPEILDAGPAINVTGPRGSKQMTKQGNTGVYAAELGGGTTLPIPGAPPATPDFLEPGSYRIDNGSGGANVGAFTANLTLGAPLTWTNLNSVNNVARASGQNITWSGGDQSGMVIISGTSIGANNIVGGFFCMERVSAGSFNIPSYVLLNLPPSSGQVGGFMTVVSGTTAPITPTPSGLDSASVSISSGSSKTVTFQ